MIETIKTQATAYSDVGPFSLTTLLKEASINVDKNIRDHVIDATGPIFVWIVTSKVRNNALLEFLGVNDAGLSTDRRGRSS